MGIETILMMIPKGGKYAKSVVNFVHKVPENWVKFKTAIQQIEGYLKKGNLKLDGKQKTNFEANKNILKTHEKVQKSVFKNPPYKSKEYPPFNVSKEDPFKGWTPTLVERSNLRNIYKDKLHPPKEKYTAEMEKIDEELDALSFGGAKYEHLSVAEKAKEFKNLQAEMKKLIDAAKGEDLTTLSLSQINKKSHDLQKRIRKIADDPNIKGTVYSGPKRDMIKAIYDSENAALTKARQVITKRNSELKYGKKYPVLDPENDAFIVLGLDERGNPIKISRFTGKFSATKDKTGELTSSEGTSFYDKWNAETNQIRKEGEEVFTNTLNREGKEIMSNPDYKIPKTENMDIQTELYTDLSTSDLFKKGYKLKDIDMIVKGRKVREYLEKTKSKDTSISMHEQTSTNEIGDVMEDLYFKGDDIYKMSIEEWVKKIPEYFAEGGRTGFRNPGLVTKGIEKGMQLKRLLTEGGIFAALIAAMEAGTIGLDEAAEMLGKEKTGLYKPSDFYKMYKEYMAQKELLKRYEVFKTRGGPEMHEDYKSGYYKEHMPKIDTGEDKIYGKPKDYVYPTEKRNEHATGGVSNLFRKRQGYRDAGKVIELAKGARWLIRMLKEMMDDMIYGSANIKSAFHKLSDAVKVKLFKQTEAAVKSLEAGGKIPDEILTNLRQDPRFKGLTVSTKADKDFIEMYEVVVGKSTKGTGEIIEGKAVEEIGTGEKILEGKVVDEKVELFAFMDQLPKELQHKVALLPVEQQIPLLKKFKEAVDAVKTGGTEKGIDVLQKQLLEDFIPKGKGNAEGGRIGYRSGKAVELVKMLPEFLKFIEELFVTASNTIRKAGLNKENMAKHSDLTKILEKWQKTKQLPDGMEKYFGVDPYIAFGKSRGIKIVKNPKTDATEGTTYTKTETTPTSTTTSTSSGDMLFRTSPEVRTHTGPRPDLEEASARTGKVFDPKTDRYVTPVKKTRTMDDLVEQAYDEIAGGSGFAGDLKYDADILASEIATVGGKIYDDLAAVEKAGIYDLAYKRMVKNLKLKMDFKKNVKDIEQKIELQMFNPKDKTKHASGGLIDGYATGGVSNLFRSR